MKKISLLVLVFMMTSRVIPQSGFSLEDYKQFLNAHQNMSSDQLLQMHDAGLFKANLNMNTDSVVYLDSIYIKYSLTDYEKQLLKKNGFMASERLSFNSFGEAIRDIYIKDLPVFVSADAIFHSVHKSYDQILMLTEGEILIKNMKDILTTLHNQLPQLDSLYGSNITMQQSLKDLDIYFGIAKKLLGLNTSFYYSSNNSRSDSILNWINTSQVPFTSLFGEPKHYIDFSQFTPRGHYVEPRNIHRYPDLPNYFKTMMWLGRVEIYLLPPAYHVGTNDTSTQRSVILSSLVYKATKTSSAYDAIQGFDNIIKLFVGESDNVTLFNLEELLHTTGITDPEQLTDTQKLMAFQDSLISKPFAFQKINSQILYSDPTNPDSIVPASSFMLLGQRFIIDSYITAQVVYDRIKYNGVKIQRMLPSTLDVLFGLGNDAAGQLLKGELDNFHYSTNLAILRYLIDDYDSTYWNSSLFNIWLNGIRQLNAPSQRDNLPPFMTTAAWWQEKMNTQLGSWTELRHDNLLYAKQSYSEILCSFPCSFVEPFPKLYNTLKNFGIKLKEITQKLPFQNDYFKNIISQYCDNLSGSCDTLSGIASKELNNMTFTNQEKTFLQSMLRYDDIEYYKYDGWYYKMFINYFYAKDNYSFIDNNFIVADIHTDPMDLKVKHVGTGKINLGVFLVKNADNISTAYVGPLYGYYDYTTTNFLRLTDAEWASMYLALSLRPDWVNLYLANTQGQNRGTGGQLFTSITNDYPSAKVLMDFVMLQNYPNPFNSTTLIKFSVPNNKSNNLVELTIYDIQGKVVKKLINEKFQSGNYVTRWEGINDNNVKVTSGVYFCRGRIGDKIVTMKMLLLK